MTFQLVYHHVSKGTEKDVGENVLFYSLLNEYPVYLLYFPSAIPNTGLEQALRTFGRATGSNLYVHIGRLSDPSYPFFAQCFSIEKLPVLVMTAVDILAASNEEDMTAFVRIESEKLLDSETLTLKCVEALMNQFISKGVKEALCIQKQFERQASLNFILDKLWDALKVVGDFISKRDIIVSFADGHFEIRRR